MLSKQLHYSLTGEARMDVLGRIITGAARSALNSIESLTEDYVCCSEDTARAIEGTSSSADTEGTVCQRTTLTHTPPVRKESLDMRGTTSHNGRLEQHIPPGQLLNRSVSRKK